MSVQRPNGKGSRDRITVPCGKCVNCLQNKRADWSFRLKQELKHAKSAFFITLTYDENLCSSEVRQETNGYTELSKRHVQLFLKRLRRTLDMKVKTIEGTSDGGKLRYYICGEYGSQTQRPHYHGIFYNLPLNCEATILDAWSYGFISVAKCNEATIHYTTKYVINKYDDYQDKQKPFSMMSTKPALGHKYITLSGRHHTDTGRLYTTQEGGIKQRLPRYLKEKIFDPDLLKIHSEELRQEMEKRSREEQDEYLNRGDDPFLTEHEKKIQRTEKVRKNSKKSKI